MLHLYTGEGKGKTTAAIGLSVRAAGRGFSVYFTQFMKGNDTGELYILKRLPEVKILRSEKNFGFFKRMSEEDKAELTAIHNRILEELLEIAGEEENQLIILDELTYPVTLGLVDEEKVKELLSYSDRVEMVVTGRNAAPFLEERADYITRMECVRHPFLRENNPVSARKGIEY